METIETDLTDKVEQPGFIAIYRQTLPAIIRHPATWLLAGLWLASAIYLLVSKGLGKISPLFLFFSYASYIVIMLLALPLTQGAPPALWEMPTSDSRGKSWLQVGIAFLCGIALAMIALFASLQPSSSFGVLYHGSALFRSSLPLVLEIILPLALLLPLGLRWREMGFSRGYHTGRITLLWSASSILFIAFALATGKVTLLNLLLRIVLLFFVAAIPEELLFRGIITTRLMRLLGTGWGIALASLFFGLIHIGINIFTSGSTILPAIALTIFAQMPGGILFAISLQRTRSLIPGLISHALGDTVSLILLS